MMSVHAGAERDFIVQILPAGIVPATPRTARLLLIALLRAGAGLGGLLAAVALGRQELNAPAESVHDNFSGIAIIAGLVLPFALLKASLHKQLIALFEVVSYVGAVALKNHLCPKRALLLLPVLLPGIRAAERDVRDLAAVAKRADFRVTAKMTDAGPLVEWREKSFP